MKAGPHLKIDITFSACSYCLQINNADAIASAVVNLPTLKFMIEQGDDVTKVCTSLVTDMDSMFKDTSFNQDISTWDVSSVTDMGFMFGGTPFNQDLIFWDVSNVTDMSNMFAGTAFNQVFMLLLLIK